MIVLFDVYFCIIIDDRLKKGFVIVASVLITRAQANFFLFLSHFVVIFCVCLYSVLYCYVFTIGTTNTPPIHTTSNKNNPSTQNKTQKVCLLHIYQIYLQL